MAGFFISDHASQSVFGDIIEITGISMDPRQAPKRSI
jgi:hypothetical protein